MPALSGHNWVMVWIIREEDARRTGGHLIPSNDLKPHHGTKDCWCKPVEQVPDCEGNCCPVYYSHNAMDGREKYEDKILELH